LAQRRKAKHRKKSPHTLTASGLALAVTVPLAALAVTRPSLAEGNRSGATVAPPPDAAGPDTQLWPSLQDRVALSRVQAEAMVVARTQADAAEAAAQLAAREAEAQAAQERASRERKAAQESADPRTVARAMLAERGQDGQFSCLNSLWNKESGWRVSAANPSGAFGIPQALPGSKMSSAGADWRTNPATQIRWGLDYIAGRYGNPCAAWSHSQAVNWY